MCLCLLQLRLSLWTHSLPAQLFRLQVSWRSGRSAAGEGNPGKHAQWECAACPYKCRVVVPAAIPSSGAVWEGFHCYCHCKQGHLNRTAAHRAPVGAAGHSQGLNMFVQGDTWALGRTHGWAHGFLSPFGCAGPEVGLALSLSLLVLP